jgi:hypothetical protein
MYFRVTIVVVILSLPIPAIKIENSGQVLVFAYEFMQFAASLQSLTFLQRVIVRKLYTLSLFLFYDGTDESMRLC